MEPTKHGPRRLLSIRRLPHNVEAFPPYQPSKSKGYNLPNETDALAAFYFEVTRHSWPLEYWIQVLQGQCYDVRDRGRQFKPKPDLTDFEFSQHNHGHPSMSETSRDSMYENHPHASDKYTDNP